MEVNIEKRIAGELGMESQVHRPITGDTHRQKQINHVHKAEHDICDAIVAIDIGDEYERAGDQMVCEHLGMILPARLHMYHEDLLHPERELHQVVPLENA